LKNTFANPSALGAYRFDGMGEPGSVATSVLN
jgi:hypothetical protein